MINFIETLFGVAIVGAIVAIILWLKGRRAGAKRFGIVAAASLALAVLLEVYVRYRP